MKKRYLGLLCMLLLSTILVTCVGAYLKYEILLPSGLFKEKSLVEVPFAASADPAAQFVLKKSILAKTEEKTELPPEIPAETKPEVPVQPTTAPEIAIPATAPIYVEVTEEWFDDALFIGDSRTVGLRDYARLGDADYFCSVGMTVFDVTTQKLSDEDFSDMTLDELLQSKRYNKVYISLGLNESGEPHKLIMEAYVDLVNLVRSRQPQAVIVLQSMITVSRKKAASEWYFGLENLQQINANIRDLANGSTIYFIDANEYYADEEGYLPSDRTWDGCHFDVAGYQEWAQWILQNAKTLNVSFG